MSYEHSWKHFEVPIQVYIPGLSRGGNLTSTSPPPPPNYISNYICLYGILININKYVYEQLIDMKLIQT